jgi:hypothetical protein
MKDSLQCCIKCSKRVYLSLSATVKAQDSTKVCMLTLRDGEVRSFFDLMQKHIIWIELACVE